MPVCNFEYILFYQYFINIWVDKSYHVTRRVDLQLSHSRVSARRRFIYIGHPHHTTKMATRRPASSRARLNSNTNSVPPQPRPKSVMAQKNYDDTETHIKVILRCRGRSEREIQENSPTIVQIEGAKSKDLTIETSTPVSSLGMVALPPTRTYPFDLVFGPEATQSMIYHDVVGPMLNEVLLGYNCTLFAYGQTGTGKT
jgi:kinesin family member 11